ncbi:MAG: response regulator transcription factor [Burkholderiaceae bacterium]|nr:response regulator transcription factor [Burkholderiaceae bacterium]
MPDSSVRTRGDALPPIRVAVVEDDAACRHALVGVVNAARDMQLCWAAASRAEALGALARGAQELDVVLVDLGLPDGSGLDVISAVYASQPQAAVMVSTIFGDELHVLRAIEAGAMGYLLKDLPAEAVLEEVRSLHAGGSPINPMVARKLLLRQQRAALPAPPQEADAAAQALSARELEVLRLVARGHTLDEVARELGVSRHTVRTFVRRIYGKLQVSSRTQMMHVALQRGWLGEGLRGDV